jgi:glycosyltransferase involved in cell wall biosynthesis
MRIIFASGRSYLPDRVDGAILSVHTLLELLQQRGHACEAIAGISEGMSLRHARRAWVHRARRMLTRRRVVGWMDRDNGYPTYRAWEADVAELLDQRIAAFLPDLVITQLERSEAIAAAAVRRGVAVILFVRDAEFAWHRGIITDSPLVSFVASSRFVTDQVAAKLGREAPCVYPLVRAERYVAADRRARFITFINPVKEKGVEVALEVARRLPHREFLFVETWPLPKLQRRELQARLARLPNVRLRGHTLDMREIYGETALLLAPSQWNEAFGRVLLEAQVNGIPVVASRIGGIPEALQSGAVLLPPAEDPAEWAGAVERILTTEPEYARLSDEARANAMRDDFNPEALVDRFLALAQGHVERCRAGSLPVRPAR